MAEDQGDRLRQARARLFKNGTDAARAYGWKVSTYLAHENGQNDLTLESAQRYGKAFKVSWVWLLAGESAPETRSVPIVGIAGASADGSILFGESQGELGEAAMPPNGTESTVAVEVRGDSMRGVAENGWWVYYDDRRDPPTDDLLGRICVVGLADGRVLIKRLIRGRKKRHFDLESSSAVPTLYDQRVEWAAPVTAIIPSENVGRVRARGAA